MIHGAINSRLPEWVSFRWGVITLKSEKGEEALESIAGDRSGLRHYFNFGILVFFFTMMVGALLLIISSVTTLTTRPEPTGVRDPGNAVLIPGVNDMIPYEAVGFILVALFITVSVHELGHGMAAIADGHDYQGFGVLLFMGFPLGAFVKLDDIENHASRLRVFSAGVLNNYVVALVAWAGFWLIDASLTEVWQSYIGALRLGLEPTASTVAYFSPTANTLFWLVFLGLNLAVINALPIVALDGGHFMKTMLDYITEETGTDFELVYGLKIPEVALMVTSAGGFGLLVFSIMGPSFL